MVIKMS